MGRRIPGTRGVAKALGREVTAGVESAIERLAVKKKKPARLKPAPPVAAPPVAAPLAVRPAPRPALAVKKTPAAPAIIGRANEQFRLFPPPTPRVVKSPEELLSDPAFMRWFQQSQVVDHGLRPQRVYHGSGVDTDIFDTQGRGKTAGTGAFFSSNPDVSSSYAPRTDGGHLTPVYLSMQQPLTLYADGNNWSRLGAELEVYDPLRPDARDTLGDIMGIADYDTASTDDFVRFARDEGYDGAVIKNVLDPGPVAYPSAYRSLFGGGSSAPATTYSVFKPQQIKSIFNTEFDPEDWRVHRARGGAVPRGQALRT